MEASKDTSKQLENTPLQPSSSAGRSDSSPTLDNTSDTIIGLDFTDKKEIVRQASEANSGPANANSQDDHDEVDQDFVIIKANQFIDSQPRRALFFAQMESYLLNQIDRLDYYRDVFDKQNNITMANKLATYAASSEKQLELLRFCWSHNDPLPNHAFEKLFFSCLPVNLEIKERELQIVVKVSNLTVPTDSSTYIIAEFQYPHPRDESIRNYLARLFHYVTIDPKNVLCCSSEESRQLDIVRSTDHVLFTQPDSKITSYDRPLTFFVDKGKSRTLKRKFKPIKLIFYEKTGIFECDKRLGTVLVRIDAINDESSIVAKLPIMNNRKKTEAVAEVRIKVREPLVNKSIRAHEEKLLILV